MANVFDNGTSPEDLELTLESTTGLINKVAIQTIEMAKAKNPLAFLDKGSVDTGDIVEKSKIRLKESRQWNEDETNEFYATHPEYQTKYFNEYTSKQWGVRVSTQRIRKIIANKGVGTDEVVNDIVDGLTMSEFKEDFTALKELLSQSKSQLTTAGTATNGYELILAIKNAITGIKFNNNKYFGTGINLEDETPENRICVVIPEYLMNRLDAVTLSAVYNLEKMGIIGRIYTTDAEDGQVYVFDEEAYGTHTRLREMTNKRHTTNLDFYYYLTKQYMLYYCPLYKATYIDASALMSPNVTIEHVAEPAQD